MPVKRIEPPEAAELVAAGWRYLDVRSVVEFEQGHPAAAYNIPIADFVPGQGMKPNAAFVDEVRAAFAPETNLVVGCKSGGRSARAAAQLAAAGYSNLVDVRGGYAGEMDQAGHVACAGWQPRGLPTATTAEPGRAYADLKAGS